MAILSFSSLLSANTNTFDDWLNRTNSLSSAMATSVITTGNNNVGDVILSGNLTTDSIITETISASANLVFTPISIFQDDVYCSANAEITGSLLVNGAETRLYSDTLSVTANTTFSGETVDIQNNLYFGGNNYVYGTANNSIGINANAYIGGSLTIMGDIIFANNAPYIYNNLVVNGTISSNTNIVSVQGELQTSNNATVNGDLTVTGTVNGRDVESDGATLDAIANTTYATTSETVLDALKTASPATVTLSGSDKVFLQDTSNTNQVYTATAQEIADLAGGVPIGSILPWVGGYFGNGLNGSFVNVLGNTALAVNTLLNSSGWYVCDGSEINVAQSTIFNGATRFLPNLTDDRFLMGSTAAGSIGGDNSSSHTHSIDVPSFSGSTGSTTLSTSQLASHSHSYSQPVRTGATSGSSNIGLNIGSANTGTAGSGNSHNHSMNHDHPAFTSGAASVSENRPKYLSVFYIMKVF